MLDDDEDENGDNDGYLELGEAEPLAATERGAWRINNDDECVRS